MFLPELASMEDTAIDVHARQIMQRHTSPSTFSIVTLLLPIRVADITILRKIGQDFKCACILAGLPTSREHQYSMGYRVLGFKYDFYGAH